MAEEEKQEAPEEEAKAEEAEEEASSDDRLDEANKTVERMDAANKKHEDLLKVQQKMAVNQRLSGTSEAGAEAIKPKKLGDTEYAEALERGEVNPLEDDKII